MRQNEYLWSKGLKFGLGLFVKGMVCPFEGFFSHGSSKIILKVIFETHEAKRVLFLNQF